MRCCELSWCGESGRSEDRREDLTEFRLSRSQKSIPSPQSLGSLQRDPALNERQVMHASTWEHIRKSPGDFQQEGTFLNSTTRTAHKTLPVTEYAGKCERRTKSNEQQSTCPSRAQHPNEFAVLSLLRGPFFLLVIPSSLSIDSIPVAILPSLSRAIARRRLFTVGSAGGGGDMSSAA